MTRGEHKPVIGVMGSSRDPADQDLNAGLAELATRLGEAVAERNCVLVTGATTGLTYLVARAARARGCWSVGVSPAADKSEHVGRYRLPLDGYDVIVYTGFGLKGRNVVNVRSSDIVIILGGGMGTLNEFTIAYDEGKVIGVLVGSGGAADRIQDLERLARRNIGGRVIYEKEPEVLVERCLGLLEPSAGSG